MFYPNCHKSCCAIVAITLLFAASTNTAEAESVDRLLAKIERALPTTARGYIKVDLQPLADASVELEAEVADQTWKLREATSQRQAFETAKQLAETKMAVDAILEKTFALRSQFAEIKDDNQVRPAIRNYNQAAAILIDLSGRMRFTLNDTVETAVVQLVENEERLIEFIKLLTEMKVSVAAATFAQMLADPDPETGLEPFSNEIKSATLELISQTAAGDRLPELAGFCRLETADPALVLRSAEIIWQLGIPQDPLPGQDEEDLPPIIATELAEILDGLKLTTAAERKRQAELSAQVHKFAKEGMSGDSLRVYGFEIKSGDWLLMRNPSPYNYFTDLSPGLFSHVGAIAVHKDEQGKRHLVVTEMPERGATIPATNVGAYLNRTLHWVFLRHKDERTAAKLGEIASTVIGNETQFDLVFDTTRVAKLKGTDLAGKRLHTYCAGFLLIAAQETSRPVSSFFPVLEKGAGGNSQSNLAKLGMRIGDEFVSPTGPLFSPEMDIVARRTPTYDPSREIQEAVYDHFAYAMQNKVLTPAPDLYQSLRETAARVSKSNPWLARALARANDVGEHTDLESAAKAAAVIETLDDIANKTLREYGEARRAILYASLKPLQDQGVDEKYIQYLGGLQRRHDALRQAWHRGEVTPRELRMTLVDYYSQQGRERLDQRFFSDESTDESKGDSTASGEDSGSKSDMQTMPTP